jgi:hypothetical protein
MTATHDTASNPRPEKRLDAKTRPSTAELPSNSDLLTVTFHVKTGQIVRVERFHGVSERHELTDQEKTDLRKEVVKDTLEALIEQAFEAGIACAFGDSFRQAEAEESEAEADLRHMLLDPLIRHSPAQRLIEREVLSRAFLGTVVRQTIDPGSPHPGNRPTQQRPGRNESKTNNRAQPPGHGPSSANLPHQGG